MVVLKSLMSPSDTSLIWQPKQTATSRNFNLIPNIHPETLLSVSPPDFVFSDPNPFLKICKTENTPDLR